MECSFPLARLGDYCVKIGSGATPKGGKEVYLESGEFSLVRSQNVLNNQFSMNGLAYITPEAAEKLNGVSVEVDDVLLNITGDSVARCCSAPSHILPARVNQHVAIIRPEKKEFVARFVRYFLVSPSQQDHMLKLASSGATRNALTKGMIEDFVFPKPDIDTQRAIAKILGDLDDKIDLLREMNRTLEEIARAVFRAWFVDFEPVSAKATGATSFRGMPQSLFDQLPNSFTPSDIGDIPTGWTAEPIGTLADCVGGGTPSTKNPEYWDDSSHPFCTPKDMSQLSSIALWDTERHVTDAGRNKISSGALPVGTVLLSSRAPIGYIAINYRPVCINQGIIALKPTILSSEYLRFWLEANMETIKANAGGTTFAEISKSKFRPILALRPSEEALGTFSELTRSSSERVAANELEISTLAALRDTLLPKLISGELEAPDLEALGLMPSETMKASHGG